MQDALPLLFVHQPSAPRTRGGQEREFPVVLLVADAKASSMMAVALSMSPVASRRRADSMQRKTCAGFFGRPHRATRTASSRLR